MAFYCNYSILGCRVIQDDLCKLEDVTSQWCKITKNEYLWRLFLYRTETLCSCYTHQKVRSYVHCDISNWLQNGLEALSIQRVKSEFPSFKKCYLLLLFFQWVWANMDITQHKHKKVGLTLEQQNKAFFILESTGLDTSVLLWWHHNHYHNA